ncbi:peroxidase-like protein [Panonychus citri]|uniref:peroxidase-like protein n=1 Tax=Panonychus citri TaxID=50023 RepID=UPI0023076DE0|nr:peroxidase-like protein [Panonychus citri]
MKVFQFSSSTIVIVIVTISMLIEKSKGSDIDGESQLVFHQGRTSEKPETDFSIISDVLMKDFLYQNPNRTTGLDLLVANIMRGRDRGIPGYINYIDYCFGYKVNDWPDLYKYIPRTQVHNLQRMYRDVYDIDLFVGGVSERRVPGNAMGPTFSCINGIHEYLSKLGDRYFHEHGGQAGSFTPEQLSNF